MTHRLSGQTPVTWQQSRRGVDGVLRRGQSRGYKSVELLLSHSMLRHTEKKKRNQFMFEIVSHLIVLSYGDLIPDPPTFSMICN